MAIWYTKKQWQLFLHDGLLLHHLFKCSPQHSLVPFSTAGSTPGEVASAVEAALRAGYRNFDFAELYGNEAEIGESLQKCFKEGVVKREEVFLTSKLW